MGEETLLRGAIAALAATGNAKGRLLDHTLDRCDDGATMTVSGSIPGAVVPSPTDFTITEGLTVGASAGAAYSAGSGVYFWKKSRGFDIGLYGSLSVGLVTNIGAGGGVQLGYFFGPAPSTLGGDSIELAVTVDAGVSIGGSMFISAPPGGFTPPAGTSLSSWLSSMAASTRSWRPQVIGVAYTLSVGVSALPVDIAVMPGRTWTRSVVSR
ncbi:hypothetical protein [Erythrobacter sp. JK5]|uniref:hypothetical protein n=1 Tax=Erythrobacter sp. JK5 TaxID=2829500 RepID=UPI001BA50C35|nr:hypothetical protein [Erythrobacter sp. JK5]QUL39093.1 hypothetical protein KDC96_07115 [Erythrobacter sp. JK5]